MADKEPKGMEGFALLKDLKAEAYSEGAFYLGNLHPDHGASFPIGIKDDRHIFINAGSRAGKGTTLIINNLIRWPNGVFCIDPKGENASITAMRRATAAQAKGTMTKIGSFIGQQVAVLDPMGCVRGPARALRVSYDPLNDINPKSKDAAAQILAIAESVVIDDTGSGTHFTDSAAIILAGVMELVLTTEDKKNRTLTRVRELILEGFGGFEEVATADGGKRTKAYGLVAKLEPVKTRAALAQEAFTLLADVGEEERGSFRSTLARQMRWMSDVRMLDHLASGDFSLRKIIREGGSVYVCIPPLFIPRMKRWLRAIVRIALDTKMENGEREQNKEKQTLFMLDEFPALGHFQLIEDSAGYMAGYGIKLVPVIQNIGQVQKHYGKNWETFIGNAGAFIAWGLNDLETEKYVSDRMGLRRSLEESTGVNKTPVLGLPQSRSVNRALQDRPIRWPNEIREQGSREQMRAFVIPAKGKPLVVHRRNYYEDVDNASKFEAESYIGEWERNYGAQLS